MLILVAFPRFEKRVKGFFDGGFPRQTKPIWFGRFCHLQLSMNPAFFANADKMQSLQIRDERVKQFFKKNGSF